MKKLLSTICLLVYFLPEKTHAQQSFIQMSDGTKLSYSISGKGKDTLLFLHGGPGQNSNGVAPDLAPLRKKHVLIVYDQRGSGLSEIGDTTRITASTHVEDLEEIRKFFRINQIVLVGHSWGCMLAVMYTSRFSVHVKKLLLLSPGPPTRKLFQQRFILFAKKDSVGQTRVAKLRAQLETAPDPLAICREINSINEKFYYFNPVNIARRKGSYCEVPAAAILKQATTARLTLKSLGDYDLLPLIKTIRQPAFIIEGLHTPVPMEELNTWSKALPNGKLLLIKKVGHAYPFVENPKVFFRAVEKFLKR